MSKIKAIVVYGGRSTEHEVSCRSAAYIFRNIDRSRFDAYAFGVDKAGVWHAQDRFELEKNPPTPLPIHDHGKGDAESKALLDRFFSRDQMPGADVVVFNIIHGTFGEDGCMQGLFELKDVAYVGCSLLGSAISMDKVVAKQLAESAGVPIVPYIAFRSFEWDKDASSLLKHAEEKLGFPIFVKPATLGSSVGVRKANTAAELKSAVQFALEFDERVLLEKALTVREIEFACLGGYDPKLSAAGEVGVDAGFYTYEEKYSDASKATVQVPAKLEASAAKAGEKFAHQVYQALNLYGLSRIDLFLEKSSGNFYFNEANTLPGFTSISQYPQLFEHGGYSGQRLVSELFDHALARHARLKRLNRTL